MQKAGNKWGSEESGGSFYILPGEERGEGGERERAAICGCLRGELSHSRLLIRNVRLMGVRVPGN